MADAKAGAQPDDRSDEEEERGHQGEARAPLRPGRCGCAAGGGLCIHGAGGRVVAITGRVGPIAVRKLLLVGVIAHVLRRHSHIVALLNALSWWIVLPLGLLVL